jgi:HNH endonuclease
MGSLYLNSLSADQRKELETRLLKAQQGKCFICEKPINVVLHANAMDIDHVEPIKVGGKDDPSNFALTHSSCKRSKQASDLRVARVLARFASIRDEIAKENRGANLSDVLRYYNGAVHKLSLVVKPDSVSFSFPELGRNEVYQVPVYTDDLSGLK